ncbi:Protein of unknown function (DUF1329) [gamma proteobacterium HdN1]|nr:Protein of unknown function (DUF1329) [gamma proteobacterium HdN1]
MARVLVLSAALAAVLTVSPFSVVNAKVSAGEAAKLKTELTPMGAERAGNADGSIPAWTGGLTPDKAPGNYEKGKHLPDPFVEDKTLFTITPQNLSQYKDKLPLGVQALMAAYPSSFFVPVYPSRRTAAAPDWVYQNTAKNAVAADLANSGNGIENAYGGVPFPIPKGANGKVDPLMVLWNHLTRWRGVYVIRHSAQATVQANGAFSEVIGRQEVDFAYYHPKGSFATLDNRLLNYISVTKSPPRLAGGAVLLHDTIDQVAQPREAWGYNAGQRKVRRAPNLAYDTPVSSADGLMTADDVDMFNGAPDKYDWQLIGKKEMYIPYNNYRLASPSYRYKDLLKPGHVLSDATRWELHRVWVIQGTLKAGQRHIYSKRTYYIDEDGWSVVAGDLYNAEGKLFRVPLSFLMTYYQVPVLWTTLDAYHDLPSKRYYVSFLGNEEKVSLEFRNDPEPASYFQPAALRRRGTR